MSCASDFEALARQYDMSWQYPAVTEKAFYERMLHQPCKVNAVYVPLPWATIIDHHKRELTSTSAFVARAISLGRAHGAALVTACQHIHWRELVPLWRAMGIRTAYIAHKLRGEDTAAAGAIKLLPCPLFAVNIEDPAFTMGGSAGMARDRDLLYSFIGAYAPHYISDVRKRIFGLEHPPSAVVEMTGGWHLEQVVYGRGVQKSGVLPSDASRDARTRHYNRILSRSAFSLCPSGAGPNSIRLWESLAAGAIPVSLSDGLCLPGSRAEWERAVVFLPEDELEGLSAKLLSMSEGEIAERRSQCRMLYVKHGLLTRWAD